MARWCIELKEGIDLKLFDDFPGICYILAAFWARFFTFRRESAINEKLRINERIRVREVRVIDDDSGAQLGILPIAEALKIAREKNLDLVEVAPNAQPPVCRIMDFGKFQYERHKKEREAKKGQKQIEIKEVRIRPKTDDYHVGFKLNRARAWLNEGNKVKIRILFRGREISHATIGRQALEEIAGELAGIATVEQVPAMDGRSLVMVLAPGAHKGGAAAAQAAVRAVRDLRPKEQETPKPVK